MVVLGPWDHPLNGTNRAACTSERRRAPRAPLLVEPQQAEASTAAGGAAAGVAAMTAAAVSVDAVEAQVRVRGAGPALRRLRAGRGLLRPVVGGLPLRSGRRRTGPAGGAGNVGKEGPGEARDEVQFTFVRFAVAVVLVAVRAVALKVVVLVAAGIGGAAPAAVGCGPFVVRRPALRSLAGRPGPPLGGLSIGSPPRARAVVEKVGRRTLASAGRRTVLDGGPRPLPAGLLREDHGSRSGRTRG